MQITLGALAEAGPALEGLAKLTLPIKTAYRVARMIAAIRPELEAFIAQRTELVKRFGTPETLPNGDARYTVPAERFAEFSAAIEELAAIEVAIDRDPVALDGVQTLTALDLLALGSLVVVDE